MNKLAWVLLWLAVTSTSRAQDVPVWMKLRPSYLASTTEPVADAHLRARELGAHVKPERRRAAFMLAAGSGMLAGGTLYTGAFGPKGGWCSEVDQRVERSMPVGATLMTSGAVLTTVGSIWFARQGREAKLGRRDRSLLALTAVGTMLISFIIPMVANQDTWECYMSAHTLGNPALRNA